MIEIGCKCIDPLSFPGAGRAGLDPLHLGRQSERGPGGDPGRGRLSQKHPLEDLSQRAETQETKHLTWLRGQQDKEHSSLDYIRYI